MFVEYKKFIIKKILSILCLALLISCQKETNDLSDLNIYIKSKQKIDSVFISNIAQDREFYFLKFSDTLKVDLKDSINDLYNIWLYSEGKQYSSPRNQFWLNGEKIIIKGTFDKGFKLDTIIGTDLHYKSLEFNKVYSSLYRRKAPKENIDNFLLKETRDNVDNILSLQFANYYMFRNKNDKGKIQELKEIIKDQNSFFKNHLAFSVHKAIDKILKVTSIDLSKYDFENSKKERATIQLESNKNYLLDLWFVNCPPCITDHQKFQQNSKLLSDNNIELIGISRDLEQDVWFNFLNKKQYPWKNYRESNYQNSLTKDLVIEVFPTYFLVKGNGKIIQTFNAYDDIESYLINKTK